MTAYEMRISDWSSDVCSSDLLDALADEVPDVLVSDTRMPGVDGLTLMTRIHAAHPQLPVIIMTAHSDLDAAVDSYKGGAFEYLPKPFDVDGIADLVRRSEEHTSELQSLMRISYAVFCLKKKITHIQTT